MRLGRRSDAVVAAAAVALFAVLTPALEAQEWMLRDAPTVRVLEQVDGRDRVVITGLLVSLRPDSLKYVRHSGSGEMQSLAMLPQYRVERRVSSRSNAGGGAIIGLFVGMFVGLVAPCESEGFISCADVRTVAAGVFGLIGLLVGALVGASSGEEVWEPLVYREPMP